MANQWITNLNSVLEYLELVGLMGETTNQEVRELVERGKSIDDIVNYVQDKQLQWLFEGEKQS